MRWKFILAVALLATATCFAGDTHTKVSAQSWLVSDEDGKTVIGDNIHEVRSIASITKLMTVMAVIDYGQDLKERIGKYTREQLIQLALVKSDNKAASTLCDNMPGGRMECIAYMNDKAKYIGMTNTKFVEPTGLSPMNISTAIDLTKLVNEASTYEEIVRASNTSRYSFKYNKKWVSVNNTNPLVGKNYKIVVSKTGTTNAAGQCLVMMVDTDKGKRVFVMLGIKKGRRASEAKNIVSI
jgi:D-alanyl-D-alanine carboxypeptidase